jgi:hypothetical protein
VSVTGANAACRIGAWHALTPARGTPLGNGGIETASSADGRFVFASLEYGAPGGVIAVYKLGSEAAPRFGRGDYIGAITLGSAVGGFGALAGRSLPAGTEHPLGVVRQRDR